MKYLKYLLGLFLVLLLIFFVKGMLTPSIYYESEIVVNKSAKEAWAVMSDESKLPQWLKGFIKSELVSGTPNTKGAVSNIYIEDRGEEMIMKETIIDVKPNELLSMTFNIDFMDMDYDLVLSENAGKTTILTKSTTKGNGLFAKSMISFMTGAMKSQEDENLNNLKKLIDENTTNYFPVSEMETTLEMEN